VEYLTNLAKSFDLPFRVYKMFVKKPILVVTWVGTKPTEPSILLNSHMDVAPVYEVSALNYGKDNANMCCSRMINLP